MPLRETLHKNMTTPSPEPNSLQALFQTAVDHHQAGRLREAEHLYQKVLAAAPDAGIIHSNLGMIYFELDKLDKAIDHYQQAAQLQPQDNDILFNLGLSLKKMGRFTEAEASYRQGLAINPDDADFHYNLGTTLQAMDREDEAIRSYQRATEIHPDHGPAHNNLAFLCHKQDRTDEAILSYQRLIKIDHNSASARHMLASLTGNTTAAAPDSYIRDVFNDYSDNYDNSLVNELGYETPKLLQEMVLNSENKKKFKNGLDMGCGTGLSGSAFRDLTKRLTGLDLSPGMLVRAKKKNIYAALVETEIVDYLQTTDELFDLFLATDVFVYLGDLSPVFRAIGNCCLSAACFAFSTEETGSGYRIKSSGRYGHALSYIEALAKEFDWTIVQRQTANIRRDKGKWIRGNLFVLRRNQEPGAPHGPVAGSQGA